MVSTGWKSFVVKGKPSAKPLNLTQIAQAAMTVHNQLLNSRRLKLTPPSLSVEEETSERGNSRWSILFPCYCCQILLVEGVPKYKELVRHDYPKACVEIGIYLLVSYVAIENPLESSAQLAHRLATSLRDELEK